MAKFAETYPDEEFVQTVSAQIPWSHNTAILDKVKDAEQRVWYIKKTAENGWSHNVLIHQIESGLYERQALAEKISNFETRLASPQSELAVQTMKDPYIFDFIPLREDMVERDIENALVKDVTKLLLELGTGFAFLGNQYHLNVGGDDFYIDLLFYNLNLRCYVVIELKTGEFKPEYPFENDAELCLHGAAEHLNGDVKVLCPNYMQAMERFCNVTEKQATELTDALSDIYPTPLIVYYEEYIKLLQNKITIYADKYE